MRKGPECSWRKKAIFGLVTCVFVFAILFVAGELLCRVVGPQIGDGGLEPEDLEFLDYSDDFYLGWELKKDLPSRGHNRAGYRGREHSRSKREGTWRIAFLGDSVTYGLGVEAEAAYPALLEDLLNRHMDIPVEVLNFGVPGYNPLQELTLLKRRVIDFEPDLVVMVFTVDDVESSPVVIQVGDEYVVFHNPLEGNYFGDRVHWTIFRRSFLYRFLYMKFVATFVLDEGSDFSDVYDKPEQQWRNVEASAKFCDERGVDFLLVLSPWLLPIEGTKKGTELMIRQLKALRRVRDLASERAIDFHDLGKLYSRHIGEFKREPVDHEHLNHLGCQYVAVELAHRLKTAKESEAAAPK